MAVRSGSARTLNQQTPPGQKKGDCRHELVSTTSDLRQVAVQIALRDRLDKSSFQPILDQIESAIEQSQEFGWFESHFRVSQKPIFLLFLSQRVLICD
jgi:hypothetical protein